MASLVGIHTAIHMALGMESREQTVALLAQLLELSSLYKVPKRDLMRMLKLSSVLGSKELETKDPARIQQVKMHMMRKEATRQPLQMLPLHTNSHNNSSSTVLKAKLLA